MTVEKYYNKDGDVAVLYSPGFGAGWSTWITEYFEDVVFDRRLVELVLNDERDKITDELMNSFGYPDVYTGGADALEVAWLKPGTHFRIDEYDGSESIVTIENLYYIA